MKKCINLFFMFFALLTIFSCRGDDGEKGADGINGTNGTNGNANVIYSDWFTPPSYSSNMIFGIRTFTYQKEATEITQAVLDQSVVLVYGNLASYNSAIWPVGQVGQLPISLTYIEAGQTMEDTWSSGKTVGKVTIKFVNDKNHYTSLPTSHKFRYVIIPANVAGKDAVDYSKMSYEEVCSKFNIKP